jgi:SAM-dependent methyltransferase
MSRDLYSHRPRGPRPLEARLSRRALLGLGMGGTALAEVDHEAVGERLLRVWDRTRHLPLLRAAEPAGQVVSELAEAGPADRVLDVRPGSRDARALADGGQLPHEDGAFDAVLSAFGASCIPDASLAATELARVVRPGGAVVLAAWMPRGLPGGFDEVVELVEPLPQGVPSPSDWGIERIARERLAPLLDGLEFRARSVPLRFEDRGAAFEAIAGATVIGDAGRSAARSGFDRLLASCNESHSAVEIRARYLVVRGRVRERR